MRSDKAKKYDFWPTPKFVVDELSLVIQDYSGTWVENSCGHGAIIQMLLNHGVSQESITAFDIDEENIKFCKNKWPNIKYIFGSFLDNQWNNYHWDNAAYNPPFSLWEDFVRKTIERTNNSYAILPNNWAHGKKFDDLKSRVIQEKYNHKYLCEFEIQQCISIFHFGQCCRKPEEIKKEYFKGFEKELKRLENNETIWKNKKHLTNNIKWGIIPSTSQTFNNSGTGPKGTKVVIGPYIQAVNISNERITDFSKIIRNGKLEDGHNFEYLFIRRHGNDKVKVGTRRDVVWCLPCENEKELESLLDYYSNYPIDFHTRFSDFDSSKKTLVPEWYEKKFKFGV
jgi:hypothetical protein